VPERPQGRFTCYFFHVSEFIFKENLIETKKKTMTTAFGMPVADDLNSLTAGSRGPVLMHWNIDGFTRKGVVLNK
jgi:hypothetical protein